MNHEKIVEAFRYHISTHVWIAERILAEIQSNNGRASIPPIGDFPLTSEVRNALPQNPEAFKLGSIGPDFFPDMPAGFPAHIGLEDSSRASDRVGGRRPGCATSFRPLMRRTPPPPTWRLPTATPSNIATDILSDAAISESVSKTQSPRGQELPR